MRQHHHVVADVKINADATVTITLADGAWIRLNEAGCAQLVHVLRGVLGHISVLNGARELQVATAARERVQ